MYRFVLIAALVFPTMALAQEFPGCTPKSDTPQSVVDYFSRNNQPLPPQYCVDAAPAPEETPLPPQEEAAVEEAPVPVPEDTQVVPQPVPEESYAETAPPPPPPPVEQYEPEPVPYEEPVVEAPVEPVYVYPRGIEINIPGLFQFRFERRRARREARWRARGYSRGYTYPQPYVEPYK